MAANEPPAIRPPTRNPVSKPRRGMSPSLFSTPKRTVISEHVARTDVNAPQSSGLVGRLVSYRSRRLCVGSVASHAGTTQVIGPFGSAARPPAAYTRVGAIARAATTHSNRLAISDRCDQASLLMSHSG